MVNSVLAILARCGSKTKALHYCQDMAADYPRLRQEYMQYHEMLLDMEG
jgi:hypothetical protein